MRSGDNWGLDVVTQGRRHTGVIWKHAHIGLAQAEYLEGEEGGMKALAKSSI